MLLNWIPDNHASGAVSGMTNIFFPVLPHLDLPLPVIFLKFSSKNLIVF
jgi:hypothetical protein